MYIVMHFVGYTGAVLSMMVSWYPMCVMLYPVLMQHLNACVTVIVLCCTKQHWKLLHLEEKSE